LVFRSFSTAGKSDCFAFLNFTRTSRRDAGQESGD
jgi:hypothetical protein